MTLFEVANPGPGPFIYVRHWLSGIDFLSCNALSQWQLHLSPGI